MLKKTEIEVRKGQMLKAARTAIRLKHSLAADEELNRKLPDLERDFDEAVAEGRPLELDPWSVADEA